MKHSRILNIKLPFNLPGTLIQVVGRDAVSQLFHYQLDILMPTPPNIAKLMRQPITFYIHDRVFHGFITHVNLQKCTLPRWQRLSISVMPWCYFLTLDRDCRIFHHQTAVSLIKQSCTHEPRHQIDTTKLINTYHPLSYKVQYLESHWHFICRLLEESDISYYFTSNPSQHTLTLTDSNQCFPHHQNNLELQKSITTHLQHQGISHQAQSIISELHAGLRFRLNNENLLITHIKHRAFDYSGFLFSANLNDTQVQHYQNEFHCIPLANRSRHPYTHIRGAQTAIVTATKDDKVKLKFPWEHHNNTSCWVTVSQLWAGNQYGTQFLPRLDDEVIVHFEQGNPEQPLVTGSVYNQQNRPPYDPLSQKHISGWQSTSIPYSKQTSNEIQFNDKANHECITISTQGDLLETSKQSLLNQTDKNHITHIKQGNQHIHIKQGKSQIQAQEFSASTTGSSLLITSNSIRFNADTILLQSPKAGTIKPAARLDDQHHCPKHTSSGQPHIGGPILAGSPNVFINGKPAARIKDKAKCKIGKDKIKQGAAGIFINNKMIARQADKTTHGGKITGGSPNVLVGSTTSAHLSHVEVNTDNNDTTTELYEIICHFHTINNTRFVGRDTNCQVTSQNNTKYSDQVEQQAAYILQLQHQDLSGTNQLQVTTGVRRD